jgi:hypothetical protein
MEIAAERPTKKALEEELAASSSNYFVEHSNSMSILVETIFEGCKKTKTKYVVIMMRGEMKLVPIEQDGESYGTGRTDISDSLETVHMSNGRIAVLLRYGGVRDGIPEEVRSFPAPKNQSFQLMAIYHQGRIITRLKLENGELQNGFRREPDGIMKELFPEEYKARELIEDLVKKECRYGRGL